MATQLSSDRSKNLDLIWLLSASTKPNKAASHEGFTLVEVLIVVVLAAVLVLIAAPGWLAFGNRQRVGTANTEMLLLLREAQAEAIAKRTTYGVKLTPDEALGPTVTKFTSRGQAAGDIIEISTERLGNDDSDKPSGLTLTTIPANPTNLYRFNFDGSVDGNTNGDYIYKIVLEKEGVRRCVVVETLLGAMSEGKDDDCDA